MNRARPSPDAALTADHGGKMADKDIFKDRGRSFEEEYFRKHDAQLIEKLRERGKVEEIVEALAVKLQIDDPALLRRIMALGVTLDTGLAFLLAPLVERSAWAEGGVTDRERRKEGPANSGRAGRRHVVARLHPAPGVAPNTPGRRDLRYGRRGHQERALRPHAGGARRPRQADRRRLPRGGVGIRWPRATARPGHGRL